MLTLSLVDIDKDETGNPRAHFLIKRAIGMPGDRFVTERGEMKVRFSGDDRWTDEREYNEARGWKHNVSRLMDINQYPALEEAGQEAAWSEMRLPVPERLAASSRKLSGLNSVDFLAYDKSRIETLRGAMPQEDRYRMLAARRRLGWYVNEGRMLPLGDNRDNSHDGRFFGPVKISKILGKGTFIHWPVNRIGPIR
jgi:signal peptidase I